jgi:hypothetical protein
VVEVVVETQPRNNNIVGGGVDVKRFQPDNTIGYADVDGESNKKIQNLLDFIFKLLALTSNVSATRMITTSET